MCIEVAVVVNEDCGRVGGWMLVEVELSGPALSRIHTSCFDDASPPNNLGTQTRTTDSNITKLP